MQPQDALKLVSNGFVIPVGILLVIVSSRRSLINGLQYIIAKSRKNPNRAALVDNYGPVKKEILESNLEVIGKLPAELNGAYMRNGSNPYFDPYHSYHWFEGSGMVHAVRMKDGKAIYCNRYVETSRLKQEKKAGKPIFAAFADQEGRRGVIIAMLEMLKIKLGAVNTKEGTGTANTSLVYHAGRLLALHEGDLPYQLRMLCNGAIETMQRLSLGKDWGDTNFTAHPKFDASTGQLHFLGYNITKPEVKLGTLDKNGDLQHTLKVDLPWPSMMHDKAITQKYQVILHFPICFEPSAMVKQDSLPLVWVAERPLASAWCRKNAVSAKSETKWFHLPSFMSFHVANAWEEGNGRYVKIVLCAMKSLDMKAMEFKDEYASRLTELTLDTQAPGVEGATMRQISALTGDFPICHPFMQGQKTKFVWTAVTDPKDKQGKFIGIAKHDLESSAEDVCVDRIQYAPGCFGGEAYFVPRNVNNPKGTCKGEDDGFLLVYIYKAAEDTSYFTVYDAKAMSSKPVCEVKIPQRIPYGFHTTFLNEEQLAKSAEAKAAIAAKP